MSDDKRFPVEVWIVVNATGDYVVSWDEDDADDLAEEEWGDEAERWKMKLDINIAPPPAGAEPPYGFSIDLNWP